MATGGQLPVAKQIQLRFYFWFQKCVLLMHTQPFISVLCHSVCTLKRSKIARLLKSSEMYLLAAPRYASKWLCLDCDAFKSRCTIAWFHERLRGKKPVKKTQQGLLAYRRPSYDIQQSLKCMKIGSVSKLSSGGDVSGGKLLTSCDVLFRRRRELFHIVVLARDSSVYLEPLQCMILVYHQVPKYYRH